MIGDGLNWARQCPCYLHRHLPMAYRDAQPCICECDVPHEYGRALEEATRKTHDAFCNGCESGNHGTCYCGWSDEPHDSREHEPSRHPCGHWPAVGGCGGCDPSAIDYEFGGEQ